MATETITDTTNRRALPRTPETHQKSRLKTKGETK